MTAARMLTPAISNDDPLWRKFLGAPIDSTPLTEQELRLLEQAKSSPAIDGASMSAEIARRAPRDEELPVER